MRFSSAWGSEAELSTHLAEYSDENLSSPGVGTMTPPKRTKGAASSGKKKGGSQALISRFFAPSQPQAKSQSTSKSQSRSQAPSQSQPKTETELESQVPSVTKSRSPAPSPVVKTPASKSAAASPDTPAAPSTPAARRASDGVGKRVLPSKRRAVREAVEEVVNVDDELVEELDMIGSSGAEEDGGNDGDEDYSFEADIAVNKSSSERKSSDRKGGGDDDGDSDDIDDDDDASDIVVRKPAKRRRSVVNSDADADSCEDGGDEDEDVFDASMDSPTRSAPKMCGEGILSAYEAGAADEAPRDKKRRKRFEAKVGRLGSNQWFMRTTGGEAGGGDGGNVGSGAGSSGHYSLSTKKAGAGFGSKKVKYTPLEQQFVDIKKKNPGTLLLVECGYKWQFFGEDAVIASKVLRIYSAFKQNFTVASVPDVTMSRHVNRLVHAGHKVGLVRQIDTAALKRASDKSSGPFRRELCEVYTRGTLFADGELGDQGGAGASGVTARAAYIAAFAEPCDGGAEFESERSEVKIVFVAVDTATGDVVFDSFKDDALRSELEARLVSMEPVEVVVRKSELSTGTERALGHYCRTANARLDRVPDRAFESGGGADGADKCVGLQKVVSAACASQEQIQPGKISKKDDILGCANGLSTYLKQFKLERALRDAQEFRSFSARREMHLGADVMRNFELFHNSNDGGYKGSLLCLVNRTRTAFGSRRMKQWIAHPLAMAPAIRERLEAVDSLRQLVDGAFESAGGVRGSLTVDACLCDMLDLLNSCPDLERGLARISYEKCAPSRFLSIISAFASVGDCLNKMKLAVEKEKGDSRSLSSSLLAKMVGSVPDIAPTLDSLVFGRLSSTAAKEDDYPRLFQNVNVDKIASDDTDTVAQRKWVERVKDLNVRLEEMQECEGDLDELLVELRRKHKRPSWEWKKVAHEEYLLEVPVKAAPSVPKDWLVVNTTKALKRFRPRRAADLLQLLEESRERCDEAASQAWRSFLTVFSGTCPKLLAVVRFLCDLDCLASHARTSLLPGYSKPDVLDETTNPAGIRAKQARHPMAEALLGVSYVPNDVALGLPASEEIRSMERCMVITGPNMGGKSSFIRMAALLAIMAQIGLYVPAASAQICPFDAMFCRMGAVDMIGRGMSTLMVELAETSKILAEATDRSLIVLDELGRGTATHDGTAIAMATLEHMVKSTTSVVMFVTHFPSIAGLSKEYAGVVGAFYMDYVEEEEDSSARKKISFLYKLTRGIAERSYGLNVARLAGLPAAVVDMASTHAQAFSAMGS